MTEIRGLTGLRGIAAIIVFFAHTRETLGRAACPCTFRRSSTASSEWRQTGRHFLRSQRFILALIYRDWFARSISKASYVKFSPTTVRPDLSPACVMLLLVIGFVFAAMCFMRVPERAGSLYPLHAARIFSNGGTPGDFWAMIRAPGTRRHGR